MADFVFEERCRSFRGYFIARGDLYAGTILPCGISRAVDVLSDDVELHRRAPSILARSTKRRFPLIRVDHAEIFASVVKALLPGMLGGLEAIAGDFELVGQTTPTA